MKMKKYLRAFSAAVSACVVGLSTAVADVVPVSPIAGETVKLLPAAQERVMSYATHDARVKALRADVAWQGPLSKDAFWRKSRPLVFKWRTTAGEQAPWKVEIGRKSDLSDARVWHFRSQHTLTAEGFRDYTTLNPSDRTTFEMEIPLANLEIGRDYYWRVSTVRRCKWWDCGVRHGCAESQQRAVSPIARFRTDPAAPRWIALEGRVANVRDLGGRVCTDGRRVRQGMIYRGQGLNDNSPNGETPGRNRLTVEDVAYLTHDLRIRTDLDLRTDGETAYATVSPLGPSVQYIQRRSFCFAWIFFEENKRTMAENFRVFCNRANYPIYFHCIGGADRTGALAYMLNGVLGVDRHGLETDWEATFYPLLPDFAPGFEGDNNWRRIQHIDAGLARYGDASSTLQQRIVFYLKDCGVTDDEIATFRAIMKE